MASGGMASGGMGAFLLEVTAAVAVRVALRVALAGMARHIIDAAILSAASLRRWLGAGRAGVAAALHEVLAAVTVPATL